MSKRLGFLITALALLVLLPASLLAAGRQEAASDPGQPLTVVRLSPEAYARAGVTAAHVEDYGAFLWAEVDAANLARLAAAGVNYQVVENAYVLGVQNWRFDPLQGEPALPADLRAAPNTEQKALYFIQLRGPTRGEWLDALQAQGITVIQYFAQNTYLVWMDGTQAEAAAKLNFVRWVGAYHPAYAIPSNLYGRSGPIANVTVLVYSPNNPAAIRAAIEALGGRFVRLSPLQAEPVGQFVLTYVLPGERVVDVARLPGVISLVEVLPLPQPEDEISDQIIAGNFSGTTPDPPGYLSWLASKGINGSGIVVSVVDEGVNETHPELAGRQVYQIGTGPMGHGTHVAGILLGSGSSGITDPMGYLYGLGVAPAARYGDHYFSDTHQNYTKQAILNNSILTQNSWNEGSPAGYTPNAALYDRLVRDGNLDTPSVAEPINVVFSAGNAGFSGLTQPHEAKNILTVASSLNWRNASGVPGSGNIDAISSFSSRGPCMDGRICPYITAPGENVVSTRNPTGGSCSSPTPPGSTIHAVCSGTSMAAPHGSGAVALVTEWWRQNNAGANPSPAMVKALIVNGAYDMGTPDIPNRHEGWGRINLGNVIDSGVPTAYYDQQTLFTDTGNTWSFSASVADPTKPFKVTLVWSDAPGPGTGGTTPAWVNDLDLTVTQGATTYRGNYFQNGWSVPGGTADNKNNIENVFIQTPSGTYDITITAANIAGDGVPYNGDTTDQDFALVCYNCALGPTPTPTPTITPGGPTLTPTSTRTPTPTRTPTNTPPPRCGPPDPFGYRCDDTVTRTYIDATNNVGISRDDQVVPLPFPSGFTFNFYGTTYTSVNVSSNGNLQFTTSSTAFSNVCPLPSATLGVAIHPFWDDLYPPAGGSVQWELTGTAPNRVLTIEWDDIQHFPGTPSGVSFEVQLEESTGDIYLVYQDTDFGDPSINDGASASVGIQNGPAGYALQYSCNEAVLSAGRAIRIFRQVGTATPTPTGTPPTPTPTNTPPAGQWTPIAPVLTPVSRPAGAFANGKFYVISGEESTGQRPGTVQIFDPVAGTWSLGPQAKPVGVSNVCAAAIGNLIYVPAGYNGTSGITNLDVLDASTNTWSTVTSDPVPAPLFAHTCAATGGKLYVAGGSTTGVGGTQAYVYDPAAPAGSRWSAIAPLNVARAYPGGTAIAGKVYVAGGWGTGTADQKNTVEVYDPATNTWTVLSATMSQARGGPGAYNAGDLLVVCAGGWTQYYTSCEAYNVVTGGTWSAFPTMVTGRRTFAYAWGGGALYAASGFAGSFLSQAEKFTGVTPPTSVELAKLEGQASHSSELIWPLLAVGAALLALSFWLHRRTRASHG